MATDHGSDYAKRVLEGLGMRVEKVPETELKTADLLAWDSEERYCIECKQKSHDLEWHKRMQEDTEAGKVVRRVEAYAASNPIAKRIKEASRQILATIGDDNSVFRCVWFRVVGHDKDLRWNQVFSTFYGASHASAIETNRSLTALYVDHASAFSYEEIDALFIVDDCELSILLNEFSERYPFLKVSNLCGKLGSGVYDPKVQVAEGLAVAVEGDVLRGDKDEVEAALSKQEGEQIRIIRMKRHSATTFVPNQKN